MILKPNNGLALEPLQVPIGQKITKMKTQDNDQYQNQAAESPRLRTNEQIEDISDGETLDNQHSIQIGQNSKNNNKRNEQTSIGASQTRPRNNRSPLQGIGSQAINQEKVKQNKNKFENAAARYKAEVNDVINQTKGAGFTDQKLLAESKGG